MRRCKIKKSNRRLFWGGIAAFLSLFVVLKPVTPPKESDLNQTGGLYSSSFALVIGIENYTTWPSPGKSVYDAVSVGNELEKLGFEVIYRSDLDLSDLENNLRRFFYNEKIDNKSRLFIWYSGHGQAIDGEGFLVPSDAPPKDAPDFKMKAFWVRRLEELSSLTRAKGVYMVFDTCLSSTVFTNENIDSPQIPMASMLKYPARQYLCSCAAVQASSKKSDFREMFIKVLRNEANADANRDNYLTASEIGSFIKKEMSNISQERNQGPQYGRFKNFGAGEFIFLVPDKALDYFRDRLKNGMNGPEMTKIPGGFFMMGDLKGDGFTDEKPSHNVSVSGIAVSRFEVTFEEYDRYCDAKNPNNDLQKEPRKPSDNGWGRGNRPIINVSWEDAVQYTKWLSQQTGSTYRLPTEAEWEYFARAGTETKYWWGNEIGVGNANCFDCGARWGGDAERKTAPVGYFDPNPFGIYDTVGNVWEWTCSEYTDGYNDSKKETECLEQIATGGEAVVLRGGSWDDESKKCRVSHRKAGYPGERSPFIGFRVVRELK
ncbi:MAG: SUMF1/EgtB/PvdO family nonheme iron enzyme [Candidatus Aminicenantes bacterium]|nr:SUMF1/EgtB/PvdO family nonheme iron enzyme [Candidatus Aminicenantes bacterium]